MIDLNKSLEFFNPDKLKGQELHIIGCGAVGSHIAELLARLGVTEIHLWDEDTVSSHNIANQNFKFSDIGQPKIKCVANNMKAINPDIKCFGHGFATKTDRPTSGIVYLCPDSIKVRRELYEAWHDASDPVKVIDTRMGLLNGQCIVTPSVAENWGMLLPYISFSDEEADANIPKSACGFELSVAYSIWQTVAYAVSSLVQMLNDNDNKWHLHNVDIGAGLVVNI